MTRHLENWCFWTNFFFWNGLLTTIARVANNNSCIIYHFVWLQWCLPPIFQRPIIRFALICTGCLLLSVCMRVCICWLFKNTAWRSRTSVASQGKLQITFFFLSFTVNVFDAFSSRNLLSTWTRKVKKNRKTKTCFPSSIEPKWFHKSNSNGVILHNSYPWIMYTLHNLLQFLTFGELALLIITHIY